MANSPSPPPHRPSLTSNYKRAAESFRRELFISPSPFLPVGQFVGRIKIKLPRARRRRRSGQPVSRVASFTRPNAIVARTKILPRFSPAGLRRCRCCVSGRVHDYWPSAAAVRFSSIKPRSGLRFPSKSEMRKVRERRKTRPRILIRKFEACESLDERSEIRRRPTRNKKTDILSPFCLFSR